MIKITVFTRIYPDLEFVNFVKMQKKDKIENVKVEKIKVEYTAVN